MITCSSLLTRPFTEYADVIVNFFKKELTMEGELVDSPDLVRFVGGGSAVKALRQVEFRQKADERILGDGDFVSIVPHPAGVQFEQR